MLMILSCKPNKNARSNIIKAWLNECKIPYVFLIGDTALQTEYVFDELSRILLLKCDDTYDGLSHKVKYGIKAILELFNPEYIIKCDDDVYVNNRLLNEYVNIALSMKIKYYGNPRQQKKGSKSNHGLTKYKLPKNSRPYIFNEDIKYYSGPLYYLSKISYTIIINHMDPELCKFEDVNVGITLKAHGIVVETYGELNRYTYSNEFKCYLLNNKMAWHDANHTIQ